jgi:hypothetical protein
MGVGADRINFYTQCTKFFVVIGHVAELGRTHKSEVCGIKEKDRPLALQISLSDCPEGVIDVSLHGKIYNLGIDNIHHGAPRKRSFLQKAALCPLHRNHRHFFK